MERRFARRAIGLTQSKIREVTRRVEAVGGVNLGQGTCALPPDRRVVAAAHKALDEGHHSYTLFDGVRPLKSAIVEKYAAYNRMQIGEENVLVTLGATGGLECASKCFLEDGDECVLFEPIYQYHVKLVQERGAIPRFVRLQPPNWTFDSSEFERAFSDRTKLVVFANPNNPTGKVFSRAELEIIGEVARRRNVVVVSDEVYEYLILDRDLEHLSIGALPKMDQHTLTLSSASKTLFTTGWRVGWCIGPPDVLQPMGVKSDETYVCAPAPLQYAVADALRLGEDFFNSIWEPFRRKRDMLCEGLRVAGFEPFVPQGAYYVLADYRRLGFSGDIEAMIGLIDAVGVGSVPGSAFVPDGNDTGWLRFCFALEDDELQRGCDRLSSFTRTAPRVLA